MLLAMFFHPAAIGGEQVEKFSDPQKQALGVALEMNKLVVSLATLVFGAVGALVFTKDGAPRVTTSAGRAFVVLTLYFAALAIYFSYVAYDKLVEMLSNEFIDLNSDLLAEPRRLQVYALTASVVLLGMLVISILTASKEEHHATE